MKNIILVGLPSTGFYHFEVVAKLLSFELPADVKLNFNLISNCLIYDARERLVDFALNIGASHIFFLDSDMNPDSNVIKKLYEADKDIISPMIFMRKYPFQPCFYTKCGLTKDFKPLFEGPAEPEAWPTEGVYEFEGVGMACCLIKTEVFKKIPKPWFFPLPNVGEDLSFCMKARKSGAKIWVDMGMDCKHLNMFPVDKSSYVAGYNDWMSREENKGKLMFGGE